MSYLSKSPSSKTESDWRAEEDHRTLTRAAEVIVDRHRFNKAMACMKTAHKAEGSLIKVLGGMRAGKMRGHRY